MKLKEEVELLERKVKLLRELQGMEQQFVPNRITYVPIYPVQPTAPWPNYPQPYIGDWPFYSPATC